MWRQQGFVSFLGHCQQYRFHCNRMGDVLRNNQSLFVKLVLGVGVILCISMGTFTYFSISYVKRNVMNCVMAEADRFSDTVKLGTHYAMMSNVRSDIEKIIGDVARRPDVKQLRIYRKDGRIMFSSKRDEIDQRVDIKQFACAICHGSNNPPKNLSLRQRVRIFSSSDQKRLIGIISPINNEPGCSAAACHAHSPDTTILGILDVVLSLDQADREIHFLEKTYIVQIVWVFIITAVLIFHYLARFVTHPVNQLIEGTRLISSGGYFNPQMIQRHDEMGRLAEAISTMGQEISRQQKALVQANEELLQANDELGRMASTDPLTGLFNRRYLLEILTKEYQRARRYQHELSLLMLDVDHFKQVNDTYGHICGDMVLRGIAALLKKTVRNTDLVARYGGEEMVVLLLETGGKEAMAIAEKLRGAIATRPMACNDLEIAVTVSIGVATWPAQGQEGYMDLLDAADQALYKAKESGRNRVVAS